MGRFLWLPLKILFLSILFSYAFLSGFLVMYLYISRNKYKTEGANRI